MPSEAYNFMEGKIRRSAEIFFYDLQTLVRGGEACQARDNQQINEAYSQQIEKTNSKCYIIIIHSLYLSMIAKLIV